MFSSTFLITYAQGLTDDAKKSLYGELDAAGAAIGDCHVIGEVLTPATMNPGDVLFEIGFIDQDSYEAAKQTDEWAHLQDTLDDESRVALYDWAAYGKGAENFTDTIQARCHRVLFMHVRDGADPEMVDKAYASTSHMREYVPGFLNSKVSATVESGGHSTWDYVFECDYADPSVYPGAYIMHPIHIAYVDRFFEPACAQWVFEPDLCTSVIATDAPFLANYPDGE